MAEPWMHRIAPQGTLAQAVEGVARHFNDRGYTFQDMSGAERPYAFPQLEEATRHRAYALQSLGLRRGDRIGLVLTEPEDFILTFLGAVRVGIVPIPLYPPVALGDLDGYMERMARILASAEARALVVNESFKHLLWALVERVDSLATLTYVEDLRGVVGEPSAVRVSREDICFLQYTSGSTSDPKGVIVSHGSLEANVAGIMGEAGLGMDPERDRAVSWLPLYHDMGLIGFVLAPLYYGIPVWYIPTLRFLKHPNTWLDTVDRVRGSITFAPPFALPLAARRARDAELARWDLSCLRQVGCGAEPISPEGVRAFVRTFAACGLPETAVVPAYGMAEATLAISLHPPGTAFVTRRVAAEVFEGQGVAQEAAPDAGRVLEHVACGRTFPGHEVVAMDEAGQPLAPGREGELCFRGPSVSPGYFGHPEATQATFRDGWLHTGDLGYILDGQVFVTGRLKDLIICNGRNYHPQSIEWPVAQIEGVRPGNVVAFSIPGETTEELVIALERKPDAPADLRDRVEACVRSSFGLNVRDLVLLQSGQLPKTSSGKLQRRKTRELYLSGKLVRSGSRIAGSRADKLTLAKHVAASTWSRLKNRTKKSST